MHEGGGRVSEVIRLSWVRACPYSLSYGHPTYHVNVIKLQ